MSYRTLGEIRRSKQLTQTEIAKDLGLDVSTYNLYEKGKRRVPKDVVEKIAGILEIDKEEIFLPATFTLRKICNL